MAVSARNVFIDCMTYAYQFGAFCFNTTSRISYLAQEALYNAFGYETTWQHHQRVTHLGRIDQRITEITTETPLANMDLTDVWPILARNEVGISKPSNADVISSVKNALEFLKMPESYSDDTLVEITELLGNTWLKNSLELEKLKETRKQYELLPRSLYQIFKDYISEIDAAERIRPNQNPAQIARDLQRRQAKLAALRENPIVGITCDQMLAILNSPDVLDERDPNYAQAYAAAASLNLEPISDDPVPLGEPLPANPIKRAQQHLTINNWAKFKGQELRLEKEILRLEKALEPHQHI